MTAPGASNSRADAEDRRTLLRRNLKKRARVSRAAGGVTYVTGERAGEPAG
jgi:hypothetical protein